MIGATIGTGGWRRTAELAAAAARKHTGLAVRILGDAEWEPFRRRYPNPVFLKLHLFELLGDEDIFYFDADAIHINPWRPQAYAGRAALTAVLDSFIGDYVKWSGVPARGIFQRRRNDPESASPHAAADQRAADRGYRVRQPAVRAGSFEPRPHRVRHPTEPARAAVQSSAVLSGCGDFDAAQTVIAHWTPHGNDRTLIEEFYRTGKIVTAANAVAEAEQVPRGHRRAAGGTRRTRNCDSARGRKISAVGLGADSAAPPFGLQAADPGVVSRRGGTRCELAGVGAALRVECIDAEEVRRGIRTLRWGAGN